MPVMINSIPGLRAVSDYCTGFLERGGPRNFPRVALLYFLAVFFGTVFVDILFREVVLPYVFSALHAGQGFMTGGDSLGYHQKAVEIAERIRERGWGEWQLRPFGTLDTPAGLASAVYAIVGPHPLALVPFNAFIHAGAAACLFLILRPVVGGGTVPAIVATLPFVLFPTAFYWHSQLHKDGIYIFGLFMFLLGWLYSFHDGPNTLRRALISVVLVIAGIAVIWSVRAYMLIVISACGAIMTAVCTGIEVMWVKRGKLAWADVLWRTLFRFAFCFSIVQVGGAGKTELSQVHLERYAAAKAQSEVIAAAKIARGKKSVPGVAGMAGAATADSDEDECLPVTAQNADIDCGQIGAAGVAGRQSASSPAGKGGSKPSANGKNAMPGQTPVVPEESPAAPSADGKVLDKCALLKAQLCATKPVDCPAWVSTLGVPGKIDRLGYSVAATRHGYFSKVYDGAGSTIDREYCLSSFAEQFEYMPRAVQIALFSPFPWQWVQQSAQGGGRAMRILAGAEMMWAYVALAFTALLIWHRRYYSRMWPLLICTFFVLLLLTIVTPNIGALHRMRYGPFMILVGLGTGYMCRLFIEWRKRRLTES